MEFMYPPLEDGQIRVLHLHATDDDHPDNLRCMLENVYLHSVPPYEAISYRWQDTGTVDIRDVSTNMNGQTVHGQNSLAVTKSLFNVLRDIRLATPFSKTRTVWADGICINQRDIAERSAQVQLMDQIYSKAQRVITYIGEADSNTRSALELAEKMVKLGWTSEPALGYCGQERDEQQCDLLGIGYTPSFEGHPHPAVKALQSMLNAPWSRRLWIVQESVLNCDMLMMCGPHEMPWTMLHDLGFLISEKKLAGVLTLGDLGRPDFDSGINSSWQMIRRMAWFRERFETKRLAMIDLMHLTNKMLCFDPRDRVYALYGVFRAIDASRSGPDVKVDYNKTVAQVYTDAARFFLTRSGGLGVFATIASESEEPGLPSWVPDWKLAGREDFFRLSCEQASYGACGRMRISAKIDDIAGRITLSGILVDRISYVSGNVLLSSFNPAKNNRCTLWLKEHLDMVRDSDKYNDMDAVDVFWRSLTADAFAVYPPGPDESSVTALGQLLFLMNGVDMRTHGKKERVVIPGVEERDDEYNRWISYFPRRAAERVFCMTEEGYCGLLPPRSSVGDYVAVVRGGRVPLVLRGVPGEPFKLLGEAYVHGLMSGEVVEGESFKRRIKKHRSFLSEP
ncbi:Heterokaryon incompatibility protein 6, OR allele [Madurella mycetomatis]|uniref:Heterokaryon incompatibility protein 6, OR allele n=1 Tax=Madurella mycetomatis TaxID=100816 RepID=A0A175W5C2_9PEZI|nr:Heterokaryon incompatibility protein 6, OR allele [Madurella mycetomatis]